MKKMVIASVLLFSVTTQASNKQVTVKISGMSCTSCAAKIETHLKKFPQVVDVNVDVQQGAATITVKEGQILSDKQIEKAIRNAGYNVNRDQPQLKSKAHEESQQPFDPAMSIACEKTCASKQAYDVSKIKKQTLAKIGDLVRCPVSGVVFEVRADSESTHYQGKNYYTCCASCAKKFSLDPEKFSKNSS